MKKLLSFYIPFNNWPFTEKRLTQPWIARRIRIFFEYTYFSLLVQTNQEFYAYILCDPNTIDLVQKELIQYPKLPSHIQFTTPLEYGKQMDKLAKEYDLIYSIRIDSDNMVRKDFIQQIYDFPVQEGTECLICQNGYLYYKEKDLLSDYYAESPSFYVLLYTSEEYIKRLKKWPFHGHQEIYSTVRCEVLTDSMFIVTYHGGNFAISQGSMKPFHMIDPPHDEILSQFGI